VEIETRVVKGNETKPFGQRAVLINLSELFDQSLRSFQQVAGHANKATIACKQSTRHRQHWLDFNVSGGPMAYHSEGEWAQHCTALLAPTSIKRICT
jgi:hypothetical protein